MAFLLLLAAVLTSACAPAKVTPEELCADQDALDGETLTLEVELPGDAVVLESSTLAACDCCNTVTYYYGLSCGGDAPIAFVPRSYVDERHIEPGSDWQCTGRGEIGPTCGRTCPGVSRRRVTGQLVTEGSVRYLAIDDEVPL